LDQAEIHEYVLNWHGEDGLGQRNVFSYAQKQRFRSAALDGDTTMKTFFPTTGEHRCARFEREAEEVRGWK
jgi:hypothetical protein